MNLFDIMRGAGGGSGFSTLGSQFGLSEEQVARAVQAFLPAFSAGLKRSTADPLGLAEFMQRLAQGNYAQAYQNPFLASDAGRAQGNEALAFLFGSPDAARAVAEQASAFTGLARDKLLELLPAVTAMMFGGLAEQSRRANPLLDAWMKQFQAAPPKPAAKGPLDRYEEDQAERERAAAEFARAQAESAKAGLAAVQAGTAAWQQGMAEMMKAAGMPGGAGGKQPAVSGREMFGEMFEPGLRLSEAYQREMEALIGRMPPQATSG